MEFQVPRKSGAKSKSKCKSKEVRFEHTHTSCENREHTHIGARVAGRSAERCRAVRWPERTPIERAPPGAAAPLVYTKLTRHSGSGTLRLSSVKTPAAASGRAYSLMSASSSSSSRISWS